jgi:hypothetical protein
MPYLCGLLIKKEREKMSLIKVKVIDTTISVREGISSKNKPYRINSQEILVELAGEVRRVPLNLPDNVGAYAPGNYTIDPINLITIGRYGFEFNRFSEIHLIPEKLSSAPFAKTA